MIDPDSRPQGIPPVPPEAPDTDTDADMVMPELTAVMVLQILAANDLADSPVQANCAVKEV